MAPIATTAFSAEYCLFNNREIFASDFDYRSSEQCAIDLSISPLRSYIFFDTRNYSFIITYFTLLLLAIFFASSTKNYTFFRKKIRTTIDIELYTVQKSTNYDIKTVYTYVILL